MTDRQRAKHLLDTLDQFGPLHIIVGDGNLEDGDIAFCEKEPGLSGEELEFLRLLKAMPIDERYDLWVELYPWEDCC